MSGFVVDFSYPFYGGSAGSAPLNALGPNQVALGGHVYMIDTLSNEWAHQSIPRLKPQQDTADETGEGSLNPEGLWRRSQESWHHGAGQSHLDKPDSDPFRFQSSKGIEVFDRWGLSMLNDTANRRASGNTNLNLVVAGDYLYVSDSTSLVHTTNINTGAPTWTNCFVQNGEAAQTVNSITSDGFTIYAALGTNGIHTTTRGAVVSAHYSDLQAQLVSYVNGRLMAANAAAIYNVTAGGAAPAALYTHPNTDFAWVGFAPTKRHILAAGYSGDKSLIYKITVQPDGTALTIPVVAGELPDGEIVRSIAGYLGYCFIGTDKGVRFADVSADGDLSIGALIPTPGAVRCFEGQDQFMWFGWTNYDASSTGLGRLDLRSFISPLTPAYASDLMATGQGTVISVATFTNRRVFGVSTVGVFAQTDDLVATGVLRTGQLNFGLSETKVAMFADVRYDSLDGSVVTAISRDNVTFSTIGTHSESTSQDQLSAGQLSGDFFNLQFTFTRDSTPTLGPVLARYTLKSEVITSQGDNIFVPIIMAAALDIEGQSNHFDLPGELAYLIGLAHSRTAVTYQEGTVAYLVTLDDYRFNAREFSADREYDPEGTFLAKLKVVAS